MESRGSSGRALLGALVLLLVLGGAGAWNYRRNLAAEEALPRPWESYASADLEAMKKAYRQEIESYSKAWEAARRQRVEVRDRDLVGDAAREFDRVQDRTRRVRELRRELAERQAALEEIEEELRLRGELGVGWKLHWQRLTRLEPVPR